MVPLPEPARTLHLPPRGRPRWICPAHAKLDLLYLGWGQRRFGEAPIPVSLHPGWVYAYVQRGSPKLRLMGREVTTRAGELYIIHPNCASGWMDRSKASSDLLVWMWRTAPRIGDLAPPTGGFVSVRAKAAAADLKRTHAACRTEVEAPDRHTKEAIEQVRLKLDVGLARTRQTRDSQPPAAIRLELALRWLAQHLGERRPAATLCEYLQISPITLNRLFRANLGESFAAHYHRLKMQAATELMSTGTVSVKEASFVLGYNHPNDFSRAFKRFSGFSPRSARSAR